MSQTEVIAALSVKREPAFTEEHERAVAAACEKLWNGEPVDDPIHSPRHPRHPLCVVGNAAHDGLNAALAMRTQLLHAWREIDTLRTQLTPGDPRVTTHHADCWQTRGHHACAIAKIEAMQKREAILIANLKDIYAQPDGGYVVLLEDSRGWVPTIDDALALLTPSDGRTPP